MLASGGFALTLQNGGRNFALSHGRSLPHARWILPVDGNCFFTPPAMRELMLSLERSGEGALAKRYVVIPMARLVANDAVLPHNVAGPSSPPDAPEEPQLGFRYDSTDAYQVMMRYGRRSKLELLWRLGAIPRERALDRRTLPWEFGDRQFLTATAYGSIIGPAEQGEHALATNFVRAGWVYRLFSGDPRQELHSPSAVALRNANRVRGIVAFLERLDERLARGSVSCPGPAPCGFAPERLWTVDELAMRKLEQRAHTFDDPHVRVRIARLHERARTVAGSVIELFEGNLVGVLNPDQAADFAFTLALAGRLARDYQLTVLAARVIRTRFLDPAAMAMAQAGAADAGAAQATEDGVGYAFPFAASDATLWAVHRHAHVDPAPLSLDIRAFDPTVLLDALRLVSPAHLPPGEHEAVASALGGDARSFAMIQLAHLLFDPASLAATRSPPSLVAGVDYDLRLAVLAAFLDDARLLNRVATRSALRVRGRAVDTDAAERRAWLQAGLARIRLHPFATSTALVARSSGDERRQGPATLLNDLGL